MKLNICLPFVEKGLVRQPNKLLGNNHNPSNTNELFFNIEIVIMEHVKIKKGKIL